MAKCKYCNIQGDNVQWKQTEFGNRLFVNEVQHKCPQYRAVKQQQQQQQQPTTTTAATPTTIITENKSTAGSQGQQVKELVNPAQLNTEQLQRIENLLIKIADKVGVQERS